MVKESRRDLLNKLGVAAKEKAEISISQFLRMIKNVLKVYF